MTNNADLPETPGSERVEVHTEVAPPEYIYWALVEEKGRKPEWEDNWSKYFPAQQLERSIVTYEQNPGDLNARRASDRLVALYRIRDGEGRHGRAREGMRSDYLRWISLLLFSSAVFLVLAWHLASNGTSQALFQMLVVFVSGAVGAVLSGTLRFRELAYC